MLHLEDNSVKILSLNFLQIFFKSELLKHIPYIKIHLKGVIFLMHPLFCPLWHHAKPIDRIFLYIWFAVQKARFYLSGWLLSNCHVYQCLQSYILTTLALLLALTMCVYVCLCVFTCMYGREGRWGLKGRSWGKDYCIHPRFWMEIATLKKCLSN